MADLKVTLKIDKHFWDFHKMFLLLSEIIIRDQRS